MPSLEAITAVIVAGFLLSASPGPSMLYILSRSVGQSRSAGFASSIGLAIGGMILAIVSALGLAAIFEYFPTVYTVVQVLGSLYLFYLGLGMIRRAGKGEMTIEQVSREPFSKILYQGILVELLNPKTIIFFLAFLPQFVDYSGEYITLQVLVLGMLIPLTAIPSDIIVSIAGGTLAVGLSKRPMAGIIISRVGGLILMGLAVRILFQ